MCVRMRAQNVADVKATTYFQGGCKVRDRRDCECVRALRFDWITYADEHVMLNEASQIFINIIIGNI